MSSRRCPRAGRGRLMSSLELVGPFLKLGFTAFGGPAAHIAMLENEFVTRRGWITRDHFLDLVGATNLIPGPNSTEMVMHIGYERAGLPGMVTAGACFVLPAVGLTAALAAFYATFDALPQLQPLLDGIKPVVIVIIGLALYKLGRPAFRGLFLCLLGVAVLAANLAGLPEIPSLLAGGLVGILGRKPWRRPGPGKGTGKSLLLILLPTSKSAWAAPVAGAAGGLAQVAWNQLFLVFLKIGAVLYGSGYVLFAFMEGELVRERGWLTQAQLLDAIAIGQFTPGPVLSSATFVGYLVGGWKGAVAATVGIFLPSFFFVVVLQKLVHKMRESAWLSAFLDAVNVAALALMASVLIKMGQQAMGAPANWLIAALAGVAIVRFKIPVAAVILGGAALGWIASKAG